MKLIWGTCDASALDGPGADDAGWRGGGTGGLEPEAPVVRDGTGGLPDDLADGDCEKALAKPAAVLDARFPTDEDTLDAMDVM